MNSAEILAGFKNALERGQSFEQAKKSFLNAGYSQQVIDEASQSLSHGITPYSAPPKENSQSAFIQSPTPQGKSKSGLIILIISLLLILGALVGFAILFWEDIVSL